MLFILSVASLSPLVSASSVQANNVSPLSTYKLYDLKVSPSPKTAHIAQAPGSDCEMFPVCGNATIDFVLNNKGDVTFTTDGNCLEIVSPSPNASQTGYVNLNCSGIPLFHLPAGDEANLY